MNSLYFLFLPMLLLITGAPVKEKGRIDSGDEVLCSGRAMAQGITYVRNEYYERLGKCYGYANCSACKTCNYCAHCNSGGSCGVCRGFSIYGINPRLTWKKQERKPGASSSSSGSPTSSSIPSHTPITPSTPSTARIVVVRAPERNLARSKGDEVNIRTFPTLHSESMGKLYKGQEIEVISRTPYVQLVSSSGWGPWYKVRWAGREGWIFGVLLEMEDRVQSLLDQEPMDYIEIEEDLVNIRQRPSLNSPILYKLERNDRITVILQGPERESIGVYGPHYWYLVAHEGVEGWVYGGVIGKD